MFIPLQVSVFPNTAYYSANITGFTSTLTAAALSTQYTIFGGHIEHYSGTASYIFWPNYVCLGLQNVMMLNASS